MSFVTRRRRRKRYFKAACGNGTDFAAYLERFVRRSLQGMLGRRVLDAVFLRLLVEVLPADSRHTLKRRLLAIPGLVPDDSRGRDLPLLTFRLPRDPEDSPDEEDGDSDNERRRSLLTEILYRIRRHPDAPAMEGTVEAVVAEHFAVVTADGDDRQVPPQVVSLRETFGLSPVEMDILTFFLAYGRVRPFERFCDHHDKAEWMLLIAAAAGTSHAQVADALADSGALLRSGMLERCRTEVPPFFEVSARIVDWFSGFAQRPLSEELFRRDDGETHLLSSFQVGRTDREVVLGMLRRDAACHILLHGVAGTGKTEFARALAAAADKEAWFVQSGDDGQARERRVALFAASRTLPPDKAVVILDEADSLLNTAPRWPFGPGDVDKGWLNNFLDTARTKVIWITNDIAGIPASLRRRFNYSVPFDHFSRAQRLDLWYNIAAQTEFGLRLAPEALERLARRFRVDAAGIASSLAAAEHLADEDSTSESIEEMLHTLLARHRELVHGEAPRDSVTPTDGYRLDALRLDVARESLLAAVKGAANHPGTRANLLFWGPPGTGKTEFVKYLAAVTGMGLLVKSASDLLSKWVGGNEKNIREAFAEAGREEAILFIDEADSFFTQRATAHRSWEVSSTNELLQQMERHDGILICATNFLDGLDRAALRRFDWKVHFQPLDAPGRQAVYGEYFGADRPPLDGRQRSRLSGLAGLTFGDFRAVHGRFRFAGDSPPPHDELLQALEQELRYRKAGSDRRVGFAPDRIGIAEPLVVKGEEPRTAVRR